MEKKSKILVAYFSASGSTKLVAEAMARAVGADLLELTPKKKMNVSGLGYFSWGIRQLVGKEERELEPIECQLSDYDLIIIGTPVWTFTMTPPVRTFLKENSFVGKDVAVFCCHGGDKRNTLEDMKVAMTGGHCVGQIDFLNAKENPYAAQAAADWAKGLLHG